MKRFGLAVLAVAVLSVVALTPASAQGIRWGVGAGLLMPMGDYGDVDKLGFVGGAGGTYALPGGKLGIRADLTYSQTSHDGLDGTSKIMGGMASLVYSLGSVGPRPYVMGGLGMYNVNLDFGATSADETKVAFGLGAGVTFPMGTGGSRLFVETRYANVTTDPAFTFLPLVVGISFGR